MLGEGCEERAHLCTKLAENVLRVELDESITESDRHLVDRAGVGPVRIVHRGEGNLVLFSEGGERSAVNSIGRLIKTYLACESGHHHVGSVERVDEVGRERRGLRSGVDLGGDSRVDDEDGLKSGRYLLRKIGGVSVVLDVSSMKRRRSPDASWACGKAERRANRAA